MECIMLNHFTEKLGDTVVRLAYISMFCCVCPYSASSPSTPTLNSIQFISVTLICEKHAKVDNKCRKNCYLAGK